MKSLTKWKLITMEIKFAMKIKEDGKTVQVLLLCTECQGELEMDGSGRRKGPIQVP